MLDTTVSWVWWFGWLQCASSRSRVCWILLYPEYGGLDDYNVLRSLLDVFKENIINKKNYIIYLFIFLFATFWITYRSFYQSFIMWMLLKTLRKVNLKREAAKKKKSSTNSQAIKALSPPPSSSLMAIGTFFFFFFILKIAENRFWQLFFYPQFLD